ncbi:MAG: alpha/beta hydrolase-fold protein, partial [Chloroflexi bacterium]|nr:alpha/beta hydrolase-fold protein [Chloroflexota bacterium]
MTQQLSPTPIVHTVYHPGAPGPLPTVVAIHGHGANGFDLLGLAPYLGGGQVLVICPEAEFVLQPGAPSYTWFEVEPGGRPGQRSSEEFERVATKLTAFIESAVPSYGGDPLRTAILGFSQGGTLAYRLGLGDPDRYRGVAALSTWLPPEVDPLVDRAQPSNLRMIVQHGTEDP